MTHSTTERVEHSANMSRNKLGVNTQQCSIRWRDRTPDQHHLVEKPTADSLTLRDEGPSFRSPSLPGLGAEEVVLGSACGMVFPLLPPRK